MAILLVAYTLNSTGKKSTKDYGPFYAYIEKLNRSEITESTFVVKTSLTPQKLFLELRKFTRTKDTILVATLTQPWFGQKKAGRGQRDGLMDWMADNLPH